MRGYGYAIGALLGLLLPTVVIVLIAARAEEMLWVVSLWPLLAALGSSVVTWWLQALIYAVLARPHLKDFRVGEMFRVEMAGLFVALVSPIRGAELPYKTYLLKRLDLSAGEGSNVVGTRVLLDVAVLTPTTVLVLSLFGLPLYFELPEAKASNLLFPCLIATAIVAAVALFMRRRARRREVEHRVSVKRAGRRKQGRRSWAF